MSPFSVSFFCLFVLSSSFVLFASSSATVSLLSLFCLLLCLLPAFLLLPCIAPHCFLFLLRPLFRHLLLFFFFFFVCVYTFCMHWEKCDAKWKTMALYLDPSVFVFLWAVGVAVSWPTFLQSRVIIGVGWWGENMAGIRICVWLPEVRHEHSCEGGSTTGK